MDSTDIDGLLNEENDHLKKLHKIVRDSIKSEGLIIKDLLNPPSEILSPAQKTADKVAFFGGSWRFIIMFFILLTLWIAFNVIAVGHFKFDPYPFILMNLILSCIAALQAPIIMMSQNRQEEKDRKRSENDYLINLKSEIQLRSLHKKMDLLLEDQIKTLSTMQEKQISILKEIDTKVERIPN